MKDIWQSIVNRATLWHATFQNRRDKVFSVKFVSTVPSGASGGDIRCVKDPPRTSLQALLLPAGPSCAWETLATASRSPAKNLR